MLGAALGTGRAHLIVAFLKSMANCISLVWMKKRGLREVKGLLRSHTAPTGWGRDGNLVLKVTLFPFLLPPRSRESTRRDPLSADGLMPAGDTKQGSQGSNHHGEV